MNDSERNGDFAKPPKVPKTTLKKKLNLTQAVIKRQYGTKNGLVSPEFQDAAEDKLVEKVAYDDMPCGLPDFPRSTFLMVFSPDGKKIASTHGNHNVYVSDLTTGNHVQTLTGHPRTPWCIAFHPSSNEILASGCLGGQVRVWDLSGGSEVWVAQSQTVIASLAFHPIDRMLVIATYNELHFWDWSKPQPFAKCSTQTDREKVRYVTFDRLGNKLITGIANPLPIHSHWDRYMHTVPSTTTSNNMTTSTTITTAATSGTGPATTSERERSIAFCYRNLMNQYNQLVRRYFDLSRSRVTSTIDRGTDPMDVSEVQNMPGPSGVGTTQAPSSSSSSSSTTTTTTSTPSTREMIVWLASRTMDSESTPHPSFSDNDSTGSDSGSEVNPTHASTPASATRSNPFVRPDNTTPTYSNTSSRGIVHSRVVASDCPPQEATSHTTDLLRALLRDVAGSESQSGEDTEQELATRSESPRAVVSRAESRADHARPVPTVPSFQLRPRLLQDPSYQLRFLTHSESARSSNQPSIGRRIVIRPGGQFVLSRHSNSPFQPRVPLRVESPSMTRPPTTTPTIPSQASSFLPARRLLYEQVRAYLCDRIRFATETSNSDSTTNYSRLAREPDADPGPEISWDSESETLIIRPRGGSPGAPHLPTSHPETSTPSEPRPSRSGTTPITTDSLSRRLIELEMLIRTRNELIAMTSGSEATTSSPSSTSTPSSSNAPENADTDERSFESHLRVQVRRLKDIIQGLRGDIEGAMNGRDVSNMLQNTSLNDAPVPRQSEPFIDHPALMPQYQRLAAALARDMVTRRENWEPVPGPSSAPDNSYFADESFQRRLPTILRVIVLRVALRRLYCAPSIETIWPASLRPAADQPNFLRTSSSSVSSSLPQPPPLPPRPSSSATAPPLPPRPSCSATAPPIPPRRPTSTSSRFERRRVLMRGRALNRLHRGRLMFRAQCKRVIRNALHNGDLSHLRYFIDPPNDRPGTSNSRNSDANCSNTDACNCGIKGAGSSLKRKNSNPQRFRANKIQKEETRTSSNSSPSTSSANADANTNENSSSRNSDMLQELIDRVQSIVHMQREVQSAALSTDMTDEEQGLMNDIAKEISKWKLPVRLHCSPELLRAFRRNVAQLRAHQLLSNMVESVSSFLVNARSVMDREIMKLYNLLQLVLELTDILLEQLERRKLEERADRNPTGSEAAQSSSANPLPSSSQNEARSPTPSTSSVRSPTHPPVSEATIIPILPLDDNSLSGRTLTNTCNSSEPQATTSDHTMTSTVSRPASTSDNLPLTVRGSEALEIIPNSNIDGTPIIQPRSWVEPISNRFVPPSNSASPFDVRHHPPTSNNFMSARTDVPFESARNYTVHDSLPRPQRLARPSSSSSTQRTSDNTSDVRGIAPTPDTTIVSDFLRNLDGDEIPSRQQRTASLFNRGSTSHASNSSDPRAFTPTSRIYFLGSDSTRISSQSHSRSSLNSNYQPRSIRLSPVRANRSNSGQSQLNSEINNQHGQSSTRQSNVGSSHSTTNGTSGTSTNNQHRTGSETSEGISGSNPSEENSSTAQRAVGLCNLHCFFEARRRSPLPPRPHESESQTDRIGLRESTSYRIQRSRMISVARMRPTMQGCLREAVNRRHRYIRSLQSLRIRTPEIPRLTSRMSTIPTTIASVSSAPSFQESPLRWGGAGWWSQPHPHPWAEAGSTLSPSATFSTFNLPHIRVNDVPADDANNFDSPRSPAPPIPPQNEETSRWRYYRPRFLHPRYYGPNPFDDQDSENADQPIFRWFEASGERVYSVDPIVFSEAPMSPHHRIQAWDFSHHTIPNISDREVNGVVAECKIHNDASVDVSADGRLLVTLLPTGRLSVTAMLGVYSLEWKTLGQMLYKTGFEQNAVSVSLSPTARHLLVGLASRSIALRDRERTNMALIYRLGGGQATPKESWHSGRGLLHIVREVEQPRDMNATSLNCIRWAPAPGQGFVYGTNTGKLNILR